MSSASEIIKGATLDRIIFPKSPDPENSFLIGSFSVDGEPWMFKALGNCGNPETGLKYTLSGRWKDNVYRGKTTAQFHFDSAIVERPRDVQGIKIFLAKRFDGIGPARAGQIVDAFGVDAIDILRDEPARAEKDLPFLAGGLAEKISQALKDMDDQERVLIELEKIFAGIKGLPRNLINRLWDEKKAEAPVWVRENPYRLTGFRGIGFLIADRIAMDSVKIPADSIFRKKAAVIHALKEYQQSTGSVWIQIDELQIKTMALIGIDAWAGITELIDGGDLVDNFYGWIAFAKDQENELTISDTLKNLMVGHTVRVMCLNCLGKGGECCGFTGEVERKQNDDMGDI